MLRKILIGQKSGNGVIRRTSIIVAAVVIGLIASPSTVLAASDHNISGDTWSDSGKLYVSGTDRYKEGTGRITGNFSKLPIFKNGAVDGLKFQIGSRQGDMIPGNNFSATIREANRSFYLSQAITAGTVFRNIYGRVTTCQSGCVHSFEGVENY